jgi:hypothetical protein
VTVLPVTPTGPAASAARPTVAIPRQSRGAHRAAPSQVRLPERSRVPVTQPSRTQHTLRPVEPVQYSRVSPAVRGAGAAAYAVVARAGSLVTLAAMLVLGGAVAGATDGPTPDVTTPVTLQGP